MPMPMPMVHGLCDGVAAAGVFGARSIDDLEFLVARPQSLGDLHRAAHARKWRWHIGAHRTEMTLALCMRMRMRVQLAREQRVIAVT